MLPGLADYGSDSDSGTSQRSDDSQKAASPPKPEVPALPQRVTPPTQFPAASPSPSNALPSAVSLLDGDGTASSVSLRIAHGSKRPAPATGASLVSSLQPSVKAQRTQQASSASRRGSGGGSGGMMLPPQLMGRSNVVTEDLSSMFTRQTQRGQRKPPAKASNVGS